LQIGANGERFHGTVKPAEDFNAEEDATALRNAMKGIGTDEQEIIDLLTNRSSNQRQEIKKTFKTAYGKDLVDNLKSELSGHFEKAVVYLMMDPLSLDVHSLHEAMKGAGTDEAVLIEILTSRTNMEIQAIKDHYKKKLQRDLEHDVEKETSGTFRRILVSCLQAGRQELTDDQLDLLCDEGPKSVVDQDMAQEDAQKLIDCGIEKAGTDEAEFIKIFALRNAYQLRATFDHYERMCGKTILESIDSETSGDFRSTLKAIAKCVIDRPAYFAERLYKAMKGAGTTDTTLIRIIVSRSEYDLGDIKEAFERLYGKSLAEMVHSDTSGDYGKFLLALIK